MLGVNPVSLKVVIFVTVVPTTAYIPEAVLRSILNPVSLVELSVQDKFICVVETTVPIKFDGATGTTVVVEFPLESLLVEHPTIKNSVNSVAKTDFKITFFIINKFPYSCGFSEYAPFFIVGSGLHFYLC